MKPQGIDVKRGRPPGVETKVFKQPHLEAVPEDTRSEEAFRLHDQIGQMQNKIDHLEDRMEAQATKMRTMDETHEDYEIASKLHQEYKKNLETLSKYRDRLQTDLDALPALDKVPQQLEQPETTKPEFYVKPGDGYSSRKQFAEQGKEVTKTETRNDGWQENWTKAWDEQSDAGTAAHRDAIAPPPRAKQEAPSGEESEQTPLMRKLETLTQEHGSYDVHNEQELQDLAAALTALNLQELKTGIDTKNPDILALLPALRLACSKAFIEEARLLGEKSLKQNAPTQRGERLFSTTQIQKLEALNAALLFLDDPTPKQKRSTAPARPDNVAKAGIHENHSEEAKRIATLDTNITPIPRAEKREAGPKPAFPIAMEMLRSAGTDFQTLSDSLGVEQIRAAIDANEISNEDAKFLYRAILVANREQATAMRKTPAFDHTDDRTRMDTLIEIQDMLFDLAAPKAPEKSRRGSGLSSAAELPNLLSDKDRAATSIEQGAYKEPDVAEPGQAFFDGTNKNAREQTDAVAKAFVNELESAGVGQTSGIEAQSVEVLTPKTAERTLSQQELDAQAEQFMNDFDAAEKEKQEQYRKKRAERPHRLNESEKNRLQARFNQLQDALTRSTLLLNQYNSGYIVGGDGDLTEASGLKNAMRRQLMKFNGTFNQERQNLENILRDLANVEDKIATAGGIFDIQQAQETYGQEKRFARATRLEQDAEQKVSARADEDLQAEFADFTNTYPGAIRTRNNGEAIYITPEGTPLSKQDFFSLVSKDSANLPDEGAAIRMEVAKRWWDAHAAKTVWERQTGSAAKNGTGASEESKGLQGVAQFDPESNIIHTAGEQLGNELRTTGYENFSDDALKKIDEETLSTKERVAWINEVARRKERIFKKSPEQELVDPPPLPPEQAYQVPESFEDKDLNDKIILLGTLSQQKESPIMLVKHILRMTPQELAQLPALLNNDGMRLLSEPLSYATDKAHENEFYGHQVSKAKEYLAILGGKKVFDEKEGARQSYEERIATPVTPVDLDAADEPEEERVANSSTPAATARSVDVGADSKEAGITNKEADAIHSLYNVLGHVRTYDESVLAPVLEKASESAGDPDFFKHLSDNEINALKDFYDDTKNLAALIEKEPDTLKKEMHNLSGDESRYARSLMRMLASQKEYGSFAGVDTNTFEELYADLANHLANEHLAQGAYAMEEDESSYSNIIAVPANKEQQRSKKKQVAEKTNVVRKRKKPRKRTPRKKAA